MDVETTGAAWTGLGSPPSIAARSVHAAQSEAGRPGLASNAVVNHIDADLASGRWRPGRWRERPAPRV